MRVILDSNILFSALISPNTPPHRVGLMLNNMQSATVMDRLPAGYEAADPNDTFIFM